ncbi:MAG: hydrogenase maturation protease [Bacteroidetes bacterium]|nr:hydrogenase maturation protease [Bacteroidota bacterium]
MIQNDNSILVMGLGNYLMGDEGLGVHVIDVLLQEPLPGNVALLDGGTGGFHLLGHLEQYHTVIVVDATLDNNAPGTIRLIQPRFASDFPRAMSTHDIGLKDMITALQFLDKMPKVFLFVVSIESLQQQGTQLTPEIEAAMPELLYKIHQQIAALQYEQARELMLVEN